MMSFYSNVHAKQLGDKTDVVHVKRLHYFRKNRQYALDCQNHQSSDRTSTKNKKKIAPRPLLFSQFHISTPVLLICHANLANFLGRVYACIPKKIGYPSGMLMCPKKDGVLAKLLSELDNSKKKN